MKITRFKTLDSTNLHLQNLLNKGEDIIDNIVITEFQTSGKGQGKNVWESEAGKNLLLSIGIDMSYLRAENQFFLTQMVSVSMINVLKSYLPEESLFIKWPNDIYFKDRKIAGILIKNEIKGMMLGTSVIGIGLNVNQTAFSESLPNPISMKMITGKDYDLEEILLAIGRQLSAISKEVNSQQSTVNGHCVDPNFQFSIFNFQLYKSRLYRYHQWALYEHEGQIKEMMIIGYDQFGRLVLKEKNDREVVCDLKEITFKLENLRT